MGKWEKFADDLEEEEALTKAPEFEDAVVDVVDPADVTMPTELRGSQVIERRHPGGQSEIFYCRPDGAVYSEAQATELIESFRAATAGGVPAGGVPAGAVPTGGVPTADMVIDTLGTGEDVPHQLRGAKLVDRGGSFLFIMADGTELPKEIGDSLFEAFESPEVTNPGLEINAAALPQESATAAEPQPAPGAVETVIDTLGEGQDVPPTLRGAKLVERDGSFFFVTTDGEAIPKEIGDDLFDAWDAPEESEPAPQAQETTPEPDVAAVAQDTPPTETESPAPEAAQPAEEPATAPKEAAQPAEEPATAPEEDAQPAEEPATAPEEDAQPAEEPATASEEDAQPAEEPAQPAEENEPEPEEEVLETLGTGEDVPPRLRGGRMVKRADGFFYVTTDGEAIPADIGEELISAWTPEAEPQEEAPPPADPAPEPGPLMKPFGYDDFGPVTVPNVMLPETIDVPRAEAPAEESTEPAPEEPKAPEPTPAPPTEKLEAGSLEDQLKQAVTSVRREAATGTFDVAEATPTQEQLESLLTELIDTDPADAMLSRMVRRSSQLTEQISEAWAGDENRARQALHRDVVSGTLLLVAVNPTQLKDLDVLGLLTLLRLRTAEGTDRVVTELAKTLRTKLADDLSRAIKASSLTDQVLQGARSTAGVVTAGRLWPEGVTHLVAQTLAREISLTVGEVLSSYRERGYAFPGLAEKVLEAYRHFATDIGERVASAIE